VPPIRNLRLLVLAALLLGAAALTLGWREGRRYERGGAERTVVFASLRARDAQALTEEAIRLYAAGQFPRACEKFGLAAADDPASSARRQDVIAASRAGAGTRFARADRTRPRCCSGTG